MAEEVGLSLDSSESCSCDEGSDSLMGSFSLWTNGKEKQHPYTGRSKRLSTWDRTAEVNEKQDTTTLPADQQGDVICSPPVNYIMESNILMSSPHHRECCSLPDLGVTGSPFYRHRARRHHIEEDYEWESSIGGGYDDNNNTTDDDNNDECLMQQPAAVSTNSRGKNVRFFMLLCAMAIVCFSQGTRNNVTPRGHIMSDLRRSEIAFPPLSDDRQLEKKPPAELTKYYMPKIENDNTQQQQQHRNRPSYSIDPMSIVGGDEGNDAARKLRPNLALARSPHHSLPIFGKGGHSLVEEEQHYHPTMEKFYLEKDLDPKQAHQYNNNRSQQKTWTSSLAWMALILVILEIGWKEYRRCQVDMNLEQEERRL